jgi:hypothetical protein
METTEIQKEYEEYVNDDMLKAFNQKMFSLLDACARPQIIETASGRVFLFDAETQAKMDEARKEFDQYIESKYKHVHAFIKSCQAVV